VQDIASDLPWLERMDLTVRPVLPPTPLREQLGADPDDLAGDEIHNDVKREMKLYVCCCYCEYFTYTSLIAHIFTVVTQSTRCITVHTWVFRLTELFLILLLA